MGLALSFPAIVYTVLLGVVLVYWLFVIVGAAHVNLLGEGAADGALGDGLGDGALEGATKGALEGAAEHLHGVGDHSGPDDVDVGEASGLAGAMSALRLRSAPATVVLSVLILFSWIFSTAGAQILEALGVGGGVAAIAKVALLVLAPVLALFPTSIAVRPLARVFASPVAVRHASLVGKLCTIRTGTVTERFGEAMLEDGGAGVVIRVRVDVGGGREGEPEQKLARGDQAVIVAYDAERQEFTVASMAGVLDDVDADGRRAAAVRK